MYIQIHNFVLFCTCLSYINAHMRKFGTDTVAILIWSPSN